jgi:hypothetical protein
VFHFNKASLTNPAIPMWVFKVDGDSLYIDHADFRNVTFSTKETPDNPHTKGSLKIKNATLDITKNDGKIYAVVTQAIIV